MKAFIQVVSLFAAATGSVFAAGGLPLPEPGSLALVGLAVAGLVFASKKK